MSFEEEFIKMDLNKLLEQGQFNLAQNLCAFYSKANELIGEEKQHNLGFLKEKLKGQIETYFKLIVKNILYHINLYENIDCNTKIFNYLNEVNETIS